MNISLKPVLLSAVLALPMLGVAQAQNTWGDLHQELRDDRQEYRQAVRRGDWSTANQKAREIQRDQYRLQRRSNTWNNGWNNNWNNSNHYYYRTTPYNYNYRYNTYPYYRTYP